jgi:nucleoside-diphosphate-sugar epimerase
MRVLVVGGAGFFGSHIVEELLFGENTVVVWDDLSTGKDEHLPDHRNLEVCLDSCSVIDDEWGCVGEGFDAVVSCISDPMLVLGLVDRFPASHFVQLSCLDSMFEGEKENCVVSEESVPKPTSSEGFSSWFCELVVISKARKFTVVRTTSAYGTRGKGPVDRALDSAKVGLLVELAEEEFDRGFVNVGEVAEVVRQVVSVPNIGPDLVHLCSGSKDSASDIGHFLKTVLSAEVKVIKRLKPGTPIFTTSVAMKDNLANYVHEVRSTWTGDER